MPTTISLLNMKGGVGKTTLAVNIAWYLYHFERAKVLLIDFDPQFNTTQYLMTYSAFQTHQGKNGTISGLLHTPMQLTLGGATKPKKSFAGTIHSVRKSKLSQFDLLPADSTLAYIVKNPGQMEQRLEAILKQNTQDYDYVLIDCSPTDTVLTTMALTASDYVLSPMRPDRYSILGFGNLMETIKTFKETCHDPHSVKMLGVIFTQLFGTDIERQAMQEIQVETAKENIHVFNSSVHYSQSFARALAERTPIFNTRNVQTRAKQSIGKIVEEMKREMTLLQSAATQAASAPTKVAKKKSS